MSSHTQTPVSPQSENEFGLYFYPVETPSIHDNPEEQKLTVYDVLPSFEMHNYILNRKFSNVKDDEPDFLPHYDSVNINTDHGEMLSENERPQFSSKESVLHNIHHLPKKKSALKITVQVTTDFSELGKAPKSQSPLKEYTSGDIVCGYIIVENESAEPIKFEMFNVSMEASAKVNRPKSNSTTNSVFSKTFMRMSDLSACWHPGAIFTAKGDVIPDQSYDHLDNTYFGFSPDRIILPNRKYKKFFVFKFPTSTLDSTCPHLLTQHTHLPPTSGLDLEAFSKKASLIELNTVLGYGRLSEVGSPILTRDFVSYLDSITYAIKVRVIGKTKKPTSTNNGAHHINFVLLKEKEHHVRFIPFGYCQPLQSRQYISTDRQLQMLFTSIENELIVLQQQSQSRSLQFVEDDNLRSTACHIIETPNLKKSVVNPQLSSVLLKKDNNISKFVRSFELYKNEKIKSGLYGILTVSTDLTPNGFSYIVAKMIKEQTLANQGKVNAQNLEALKESLSDSSFTELESLELEFEYEPFDESIQSKKAPIPNITIKDACLEAVTITTTSALPITFENCLDSSFDERDGPESFVAKYKAMFALLKTRYDSLLKEERLLFSAKSFADLQSILGMTSYKNSIPLFAFKPQSITDWRAVSTKSEISDDSRSSKPKLDDRLHETPPRTLKQRISLTPQKSKSDIRQWPEKAGIKYQNKTTLKLLTKDIRSLTVLPTFESCLMARLYFINLTINVQSGGNKLYGGTSTTKQVYIPVRVGKFS